MRLLMHVVWECQAELEKGARGHIRRRVTGQWILRDVHARAWHASERLANSVLDPPAQADARRGKVK